MMIPTQSWALTGAPNRLLTLEQLWMRLVSVIRVTWFDLEAHNLEKGSPSSLANAQSIRPVPIGVLSLI